MSIEVAHALRAERVAQLEPTLAALPLPPAGFTLEIGCGHGHFLTAYASSHPETFCLGIDLLADRLARAGRKSARVGLRNIHWVQAEADELLDALPADVRVTRHVFILFPDPWPKRRHWKNRLIQPGFLTRLARRCAPTAQLCFRTDHAPYFEAAMDVLTKHPDWQLDHPMSWPFEEATVFQSRAPVFQSAVAKRRAGPED